MHVRYRNVVSEINVTQVKRVLPDMVITFTLLHHSLMFFVFMVLCFFCAPHRTGVAKLRLFERFPAALWAFRKIIYLFFIFYFFCKV